jgi:hypothetical protein
MITQTAPEGESHFVMTMAEHMQMCGQMARAFGNEQFARLDPYEQMLYVVENHDRGWDEYDSNPGLDEDRLPYIMSRTPTPENMRTNELSPEYNEAHHPYCGLISSMHSWGLYHKRYGFSRFVVRARTTTSITVKTQYQPAIDAMLANELARQERLKAYLATNPSTAAFVQDKKVLQNYKLLQFFDTLALYFNLYHAAERGEQEYVHVPLDAEADATLMLRRVSDDVYSLSPFPFAGERIKLVCPGRYTRPFPEGFDESKVGAVLKSLPTDKQTYELIAA